MPRDSIAHRLDARAKLVAALLLAAAAVAGAGAPAQAGVFAALVATFAAARLPLRLCLHSLRGALWIVLFVVVSNLGWLFLVRQNPGWGGGEAALRTPLDFVALVTRLFNLLLLAVVFTATTLPVDAAAASERLLRPLAKLRLPVHELGMLLVLTLSFVPLFLREAQSLAAAHRTKVGRARWGFADRVRALVPLTVPLFLAVVRRADELAVALDARCFVPGAERTAFARARFGGGECATVALAAALLVACVAA